MFEIHSIYGNAAVQQTKPPNRNPLDRMITEVDRGLRTLFATPQAQRVRPEADDAAMPDLGEAERRQALELMRINHAGEVAAQALYHGQAVTARDPATREKMQQAAEEETDHLAWCESRIRELGGEPSRLGPLWYGGSFVIGAAAGLVGDRVSLGFVAETEKQVVKHLEGHLQQLPAEDKTSRAIVAQMRDDEAEHGETALNAGGVALPEPIQKMMAIASKVMTRTAGKF